MLATTVISPTPAVIERTKRLADELGARCVERKNWTLSQLMRREQGRSIMVVAESEVKVTTRDGNTAVFHPSMAHIRMKRLLSGEKDALLEAADARAGDRIIDCTMGLAADAIILAWAAGRTGEVIALESEPVVYVLTREGLANYVSDLPELTDAMRRIQAKRADHLDYLRLQPDGSADIVYFDPMFRSGVAGSAIDPMRGLVNESPLRLEAVEEACRVARRAVVMKERRGSSEWRRLGFDRMLSSSSGIAYGVIVP